MTLEQEWPSYHTPPAEILKALGVICVNYNRLELILYSLFYFLTGIPNGLHSAVFGRINDEARIDFMRLGLKERKFPAPLHSRCEAFLAAFQACGGSRHALLHSIHPEGGGGVMFKMTKRGGIQTGMPTIEEIKQAADDMHNWGTFGGFLINATMRHVHMEQGWKPNDAPPPWPETPAQPENLSHKYLSL